MATRVSFENSNDIGVFAKLTNAYCLCAVGAAENFYRCSYAVLEHSMHVIPNDQSQHVQVQHIALPNIFGMQRV